MNLLNVVIIVGVVVWVIGRRLAGEPLQARRLAALPLVLVVIGVSQLARQIHGIPGALDIVLLAVDAGAALVFGLWRGTTIGVFTRDGHLWYRYRPATLGVWAVSLVVRLGLAGVAHAAGASGLVAAASLALFGVTLAGEAAVVGLRGVRSGVPFAPERSGHRGRWH